jgi:hypothetical protein
MTKSDNGISKLRSNIWGNRWWIVIMLPIVWAVVTDHFTIRALAAESIRLAHQQAKHSERDRKIQGQIMEQLRIQATTNGQNQALLETIASQNRLIQARLWELKKK